MNILIEFGYQSTNSYSGCRGTNYFFEIAKLRALRLLFNLVAKEYNHDLECHLLVSPTKRNKTSDYNVNMLRTTTECMSAIIGGADAIANHTILCIIKTMNLEIESPEINC
jgi:methylmalonyl-CoA mutase N-terminal domain/subunit